MIRVLIVDDQTLVASVVLVVAIVSGNAIGSWMRGRMSERATTVVTYGSLMASIALAVLGVAH